MALFCCCHIFANLAFADSALTVGASGGSINPMVELSNAGRGGVAQRITSSDVSVRIRGSCYATNLRGVANPISPNSTLRMSGKMSLNGAASSDFSISIPARIVVGGGLSGAGTQEFGPDWMTGLPSNARLAASGSMVMLKILTADTAKLDPVTATISPVTFASQLREPEALVLDGVGEFVRDDEHL